MAPHSLAWGANLPEAFCHEIGSYSFNIYIMNTKEKLSTNEMEKLIENPCERLSPENYIGVGLHLHLVLYWQLHLFA